jgi:hypothetical protein
MHYWVDDRAPDWSDAIALELVAVVKQAMPKTSQIEQLVERIPPLQVSDYPTSTAKEMWPPVLKDAAAVGKLRRLIGEVKAHDPGVTDRLDAVLAAPAAGGPSWYSCQNPWQARLVGPRNRKAVIDRVGLGPALMEVVDEGGLPVLSIIGDRGRGKSHSLYLLRHILAGAQPTWEPFVVDVADQWAREPEVDAVMFLRVLSQRLGFTLDLSSVDLNTEWNRIARESVNLFVGQFRTSLPDRRRLLFLDGLDRSNVATSVHAAVSHLAREVQSEQLKQTRLIVTGHSGEFATEVQEVLAEDRAEPLTETHVRGFFEEVATHVGRDLKEVPITKLVVDTLAAAPLSDHRAIGLAASNLAHSQFGTP